MNDTKDNQGFSFGKYLRNMAATIAIGTLGAIYGANESNKAYESQFRKSVAIMRDVDKDGLDDIVIQQNGEDTKIYLRREQSYVPLQAVREQEQKQIEQQLEKKYGK